MSKPIYLDYNATTPVHPEVQAAMQPYFSEDFGNAASPHVFGRKAKEVVEEARAAVAHFINAEKAECITFTSGATESNNLALKGLGDRQRHRLRDRNSAAPHIVSQKTEHSSVLEPLHEMEQLGHQVTFVDCNRDGHVSLSAVEKAVKPETFLVSIMYANNEIGALQPLREIGAMCQAKNIHLHSDAVQAVGKIPVDVQADGIQLLSLSGHKIYGPKGIGALYVSSRHPPIRLTAQMVGGGHERGLRSGTLPVPLIVGLGAACTLAQKDLLEEATRQQQLKMRLWTGLREGLGERVALNGSFENTLHGTLNVRFAGVEGESLLMSLAELAVASGSACDSAQKKASHVLLALGLSEQEAHSCLRFTLGRPTTADDIDTSIRYITEKVRQLSNVADTTQRRAVLL